MNMIKPMRLALPKDQLIGPSKSLQVRSYATAKAATSGGKKKEAGGGSRGNRGQEGAGDPRLEAIKKNLFESSPSDEQRLQSLAAVVPSLSIHETITRAFSLFQRHRRLSLSSALQRKYDSMRSAIDLLEQTDKTLWEKAVEGKRFQNVDQKEKGNERLEGLWPREMRVPMERPGGRMWDSEWKRGSKEAPPKK